VQLIFGCGYLGRRVVQRWQAAGKEVAAVTRSASRAADFRASGIRAVLADVTSAASLAKLPAASTVLFAVGHDRTAGHAIREVYVGGLKAVLDALPAGVERFIYVSSTGVYAQHDGGWVTEDSPALPTRAGGEACLEAEQRLAAHPLGQRAVVLRMAGIYGPGRIPRLADLRAGSALAATSEGWLNLIHVDDAADVVVAAAERAPLPRTYLVSDGAPVARREYYAELSRLAGTPPPTFVAPSPESPQAQRAESSKRVSNARMLRELGVTLRYPSYREGLAALVRGK
jgi:nucleoside-diphosphate-sugar epimerase